MKELEKKLSQIEKEFCDMKDKNLKLSEEQKQLSVLTTKGRKHIKKSNFVFPKEKRYPIHDLAHARNALARSSGKPEEAQVKSAVYKKYPQLKKDK